MIAGGITPMPFGFPKLCRKHSQSVALEYSQATEDHISWPSHTQSVQNTQYFNNPISATKSKVTLTTPPLKDNRKKKKTTVTENKTSIQDKLIYHHFNVILSQQIICYCFIISASSFVSCPES